MQPKPLGHIGARAPVNGMVPVGGSLSASDQLLSCHCLLVSTPSCERTLAQVAHLARLAVCLCNASSEPQCGFQSEAVDCR